VQAQYLLGALQRVAEGAPAPPAGSVPLTPDSPPRALSSAEATVLAAQLGGHLAPLLTDPYVIGDAFLPYVTDCLRRAKGSDAPIVRALALALRVSRSFYLTFRLETPQKPCQHHL